ncbi:MAG: hypothetical protein HUU22_19035 [Phycisphaerae bacterium]|nr:hypothetical protein [Phycisphaerae bacterium]NUQ48113.1 hypothetical protein [Phycisphaerae bacterium]
MSIRTPILSVHLLSAGDDPGRQQARLRDQLIPLLPRAASVFPTIICRVSGKCLGLIRPAHADWYLAPLRQACGAAGMTLILSPDRPTAAIWTQQSRDELDQVCPLLAREAGGIAWDLESSIWRAGKRYDGSAQKLAAARDVFGYKIGSAPRLFYHPNVNPARPYADLARPLIRYIAASKRAGERAWFLDASDDDCYHGRPTNRNTVARWRAVESRYAYLGIAADRIIHGALSPHARGSEWTLARFIEQTGGRMMWWFTTPSRLARDVATIPEVPA